MFPVLIILISQSLAHLKDNFQLRSFYFLLDLTPNSQDSNGITLHEKTDLQG